MSENKAISYGKQTITEEDIEAVVSVLKSPMITQGPKIGEFENKVAQYHGAKYGVSFCNGTAALHAAYSALGIGEGDEVITSPITFVATANAAVYLGAEPVFADIDIKTYCLDIKEAEKKITKKTKVITPVAFAGYPVDLNAFRNLADNNDLKVLYDAAHAIGSKRNGSFGMEYVDAAILSFHPVKHIATGEGGMVLTNDEKIYQALLLFRNHGISKDPSLITNNDEGPWYYEMLSVGYNYRITDIQAALGISQFERIDDNLKSRNEIACFYQNSFSECKYLICPPDVGFEISDNPGAANIHSYHLYTLRLDPSINRLEFFNYLKEKGIFAQIHYIPVYTQPYYHKKFGYTEGLCPQAELYYSSEVSIPMYHNMTDEDREYVVNSVLEYHCFKI